MDSQVTASLWQMFRAAGVSDPVIAIEQMAYLMALRRLNARREGVPNVPVPHWVRCLELSDPDLMSRMDRDLVPAVAASMPASIRPTIEEARFAITDAVLLRRCMSAIDSARLDWADPAAGGEYFEGLLGWLQAGGPRRHPRTAPALAAAMVELVDPQPGDRVCDPAVGVGSLLLTAAERLRPAGGLETVWGYDINPGMARLAAFNLSFHGVLEANIEQADVLAAGFHPKEFDAVICAPPFGGTRVRRDLDPELRDVGKRTELLYLERCRQLLVGSAAILIPEAVLFGRERQFRQTRQEWLQHLRVRGVILLPAGLLHFTNVRSAILVASAGAVTGEVWFCPVGEGPTPVAPDDPEIITRLGYVAEALRFRADGVEPSRIGAKELAERMFSASINEIRDKEWSLAPTHYRPVEIQAEEGDPAAMLEEVRGLEAEITDLIAEARELLRPE